VTSALVARPVAKWLRDAGVRWWMVGGVGAFALVATFAVPPRTNRIYYDEQIYQSVAHNMADLGLAQMCNEGSLRDGRLECARGEYNKQPYGYPHLLSVLYRGVGVHEWVAHALNPVSSSLLAAILCLIVVTESRDRVAGVFAGLMVAALPEQLLWARTAASEPTASMTASLAVLAWLVFARLRTSGVLAWATAVTAWALQFRPESVLILPVVVLIVVLKTPGELARPRLWWSALAGLALCAVLVGHTAAVRHEGWGAAGERLSLSYVRANLAVNGWFYLWDPRFPWFLTPLTAAGVVSSWRRWPLVLVTLSWFTGFFGTYLLFYAGSYDYGADVRYSLLTYPPLAALAGLGVSGACAGISRISRVPVRAVALAACVALGFAWAAYLPLARAVGEEAWAARADVEAARGFARRIPEDGVVLTHNPNMFLLWGTNAAQTSLATTEPEYVARTLFADYRGGVYFHWNFWCNVDDPLQRSFCDHIASGFGHEVVESRVVRDQRFALYRLKGRR
jgi:hypothetical protein